jgi:hypothetical protein
MEGKLPERSCGAVDGDIDLLSMPPIPLNSAREQDGTYATFAFHIQDRIVKLVMISDSLDL